LLLRDAEADAAAADAAASADFAGAAFRRIRRRACRCAPLLLFERRRACRSFADAALLLLPDALPPRRARFDACHCRFFISRRDFAEAFTSLPPPFASIQ